MVVADSTGAGITTGFVPGIAMTEETEVKNMKTTPDGADESGKIKNALSADNQSNLWHPTNGIASELRGKGGQTIGKGSALLLTTPNKIWERGIKKE